jgi:hypothetical protein
MPVAVKQQFDQFTQSTYDAVNEHMGVADSPPEGLIVHTAGTPDGKGFLVYDVWESQEAFERFRDERLLPAVREVIGPEALEAPPDTQIWELRGLIGV